MSTPESISSLAASALGSSTSVPVVNQALEPASVRDGSATVKQDYNEALSFESVLVNQLCQQLVASSGLSGSDAGADTSSDDSSAGSSGDAGLGDFASMLPSALTSAIMSDGGLGLAAQLLPSLEAANASGSANTQGASAADGAGTTVAA
jgi:Rod binding domain-containing protein